MSDDTLLKLIESQSAELAALRQVVEDNFQTLNWKIDRLVEIVDNLNSRELINNKRLSKLEVDVGVLKEDVGVLKADVSGLKVDVSGLKVDVSGLKVDVAAIKAKLSA